MVVILMGVAGAGKTAVGESLVGRLGWRFYDGDDFQPAANVRKMSSGQALTDEDRRPWLEFLHTLIVQQEAAGASAVVACSALKERYRQRLLAGTRETHLVYLRGSHPLIARRLAARRGHFFDPGLLASQFEALEEPVNAVVVDVDADIESITDTIIVSLSLGVSGSSEEQGD